MGRVASHKRVKAVDLGCKRRKGLDGQALVRTGGGNTKLRQKKKNLPYDDGKAERPSRSLRKVMVACEIAKKGGISALQSDPEYQEKKRRRLEKQHPPIEKVKKVLAERLRKEEEKEKEKKEEEMAQKKGGKRAAARGETGLEALKLKETRAKRRLAFLKEREKQRRSGATRKEEEEEETAARVAPKRDVIAFGEVAQRPPTFTGVEKLDRKLAQQRRKQEVAAAAAASVADGEEQKQEESDESGELKPRDPAQVQREYFERLRQRVVANYKEAKRKARQGGGVGARHLVSSKVL